MISAVMATTLAWRDATQHKSNEFRGIALAETGSAILEKYDKESATPLSGAEFELYRIDTIDGNEQDTFVGRYETSEAGIVRADGLFPGSYYWLETNPVYGWTYDKDSDGKDLKKYPFTLVEGEDGSVAEVSVTAFNEQLYADLTITKTVENADAQTDVLQDTSAAQAQDPAAAETPETADPSSPPDETAQTGTPEAGADSAGAGSESSVDSTQTEASSDPAAPVSADPAAAPVTDADSASVAALAVTGAAEAANASAAAAALADTAVTTETPAGASVNTSAATGTQTDAAATTEAPADISADTSAAAGTRTDDSTTAGDSADTSAASGTQIETAASEQMNTLFEFTVSFTDIKDGPVKVVVDGTEQELEIVDGKLTIHLKHGQEAVIKDLPVGTEYVVEEKAVEGYSVSGENHQGIIPEEGVTASFINMYGGKAPGKLVIEKTVTGEGADPEKGFRFTVTIGGEEFSVVLKDGGSKEFELPSGAAWSVKEDNYIAEGYIGSSNMESYVDENGVDVVRVTQTNAYVGPAKVDIKGEKTWDLAGEDIKLPDSITVNLKDGDAVVDTATVKPDQDGKWKYSFTALKYRPDGVTQIIYTVDEVPVPGFSATVAGYDIRNTLIPPSIVVVPPVQKIVTGNPKDTPNFQFKLAAVGEAPMPVGSANGEKAIMIHGAGEASFGQITYDKTGTYNYLIAEVQAGDTGWTFDNMVYTMTVTVKSDGGQLVAGQTLSKTDGTLAGSKATFVNKYISEDKPKEPVTPSNPDRPKTGDNSNIWLWATVLVASAFALRFVLSDKRRANSG